MKALVYHGPNDVQIDDKPRPNILKPDDVILRVTSTALCGSDLHLYHGTVPGMEPGQTLGHELWSQCDRSNPKGELGASFGYTQVLGGYDGRHAEYVRIPLQTLFL